VNILEQKRKLLGHCYMGGGGGGSGGGGSNPGDTGRGGGGAHVGEGSGAAPSDGSAPPSGGGGQAPAESAPAPVAAAPDAPAAPSEADKTAADNIARERATTVAAAAEAQRAAEAQQAAAASLMGGAGENQSLSPFSDVSLSSKQEANLAKTEQVNALRQQANEKLASYYGKDANKYATTADKDPNAVVNVYKDLMGPLTKQTMMLGGGKNNPEGREVSVDVPQNTFVDAFGRSPTYAESKALQAAGLGNITGVNAKNLTNMNASVEGVEGLTYNDPGQTADSIVATTDFVNFVEPLARAAAFFIPGMSLALTLNDMYTGKITAGEVASSVLLSMLAKNLKIPVGIVTNALNGNPGNMLSSALVGQINSYAAKELGTNPIFTGILGKESGLYGEIGKSTSGLNQNWGTTKAISNAFNEGLRNLGITAGAGAPNSATGETVNTGVSTQDTLSNYLDSASKSSSNAPTAPAPPSTTPSITAPTTPTIAPGASTTGTGASTISTQGNLFNPLGLTAPQTQQMTNAFPQLANVFYYGKDTGSKKQKLDENNQLVFENQDQGLASGGRIADNKDDAIDAYIRHIVEQSGGPMSHRELLAIVKGL